MLKFIAKKILIVCVTACLVLIGGCGKETSPVDAAISISAADTLWGDCAFLSSAELDELESLEQQLARSDSLAKDRETFDRYLKILNLSSKSDAQLQRCAPANAHDRQRLMKHFVFLGLSYGKGDFSFVDNPRLASVFEMDYFYWPRDFLNKSLERAKYSEAEKKLARYLLGGVIAMQASVKMQAAAHDVSSVARDIAKGFFSLKYGRTSVFNQIIFTMGDQREREIREFLLRDTVFSQSFEALSGHKVTKTYPMLLKREYPFWPRDYSEVIGERNFSEQSNTVFGISTGSGGGTPLGTGFFGKSSNKIVFLTSGHWRWQKSVSIMRQKDADPFGSAKAEFIWLGEKLDLFNFSEELLVPILKALELDDAQIAALQAKIGDNPFSSNFTLPVNMPWIDMAIAVPSPALLSESGVKTESVMPLGSLKENSYFRGYTMGFGLTEDLDSGDFKKDKSPGMRRFGMGDLVISKIAQENGPELHRMLLYTPLNLRDLKNHPLEDEAISVFSMRFGPRCSGAPFIVNQQIVGLLQGPITRDNDYAGVRGVQFTDQSLALIDELITDPRGLHGIGEADLVRAVRKHMFANEALRKQQREALIEAYKLPH